MIDIARILELTDKYEDQVIANRRKIHENPELAFEEYETSAFVKSELKNYGIEIQEGTPGTGVVGILEGKSAGKVLLLRADMDALPIEEAGELEFKSKNKGVMHACGHDVHTANLLGVARILSELKDEFTGTVKFVFQPAEERGGGGRKMVEDGVLENPKVDAAIALHIMPDEEGFITISDGNITSYSDSFTIEVRGVKAHSSKPQEGVDAINIAANIVVALNSVLSKNIDPFEVGTFSIGKINGGGAINIVADEVELRGMMRTTSEEGRNIIKTKIEEISRGIAMTYGGQCDFKFIEGYPSVYNDVELTQSIKQLFIENYHAMMQDIDQKRSDRSDLINKERKTMLGAEDFGFFAQNVPVCFYMVGTGDYAPAHNPDFFVNEDYIKLCSRTMLLGALSYLGKFK